jgi:glyoxylase-like metal-dependent hydrolase (beta-lactamase superfamily II)
MILFIFTLSFTADCESEELKLQKLTDSLYVVFGGGGNVAIFITEDGIVMVDAKLYPYQSKEIIAKIRPITDKPIKYLIYTHFHADHTNGAQALPKSTIIISHENTYKNMRNKDLPYRIITSTPRIEELEQKLEKQRKEKSPELTETEKEIKQAKKIIEDLKRLKLIFPDITFKSKAVIELGGKKVILLYMGNAHTDCDAMVYFPTEKAIHMGDLLFHNMIPSIIHEAGGNTENWIKILEKVADMDVEIVIPGHGEIADKQGLLFQAEFFKDLRAEVKKYVDKGASLEEIKEKLKLPKYENTRGYDNNLTENITVAYHEMTKKNK